MAFPQSHYRECVRSIHKKADKISGTLSTAISSYQDSENRLNSYICCADFWKCCGKLLGYQSLLRLCYWATHLAQKLSSSRLRPTQHPLHTSGNEDPWPLFSSYSNLLNRPLKKKTFKKQISLT